MADTINDLVAELFQEPGASARIATVTSLSGTYALTDITGSAKIVMNSDVQVTTGDRVLLLKQGNAFTLVARLSGSQSTGFAPIGTILNYGGTTAPTGWLLCTGQAVSRTAYPQLFAVLGTTYGAGDGSSTFNLPNLQNRFPLGPGSRNPGDTGGAETVTLTTAQMPNHSHTTPSHTHTLSHTHSIPRAANSVTVASGTGATVAGTTAGNTGSESNGTTSSNNGGNTGGAGSGSAHENMPPFLVLPYIIRAN